MARVGVQNGAPREQDNTVEYCPVCKSSTYMNKNMTFLINPDCYHKMCTSCVDRIFAAGPAPCPIAGCKRTLRKHRFRKQLFQDIAMDREIDVRRRVREVFNRREDEFEDLASYNNYLEKVEDLTFQLLYSKDSVEAERTLDEYRKNNASSIRENAQLERDEDAEELARLARYKEAQGLRRRAYLREDEENESERRQLDSMIIEQLAAGNKQVDAILRDGERARKSAERHRAGGTAASTGRSAVTAAPESRTSGATDDFVIRGLKKRTNVTTTELPYDAFGGLELVHNYFTLQNSYPWDSVNKTCDETKIVTGGYDRTEYFRRALCDAFSGLAVFVGDEASHDANGGSLAATAAGVAATATAGSARETDDVF